MHDRKMVLNNVEILLVVKVIEDDWKMEKTRSFLHNNKGRPHRHMWGFPIMTKRREASLFFTYNFDILVKKAYGTWISLQ